MYNKIKQSPYKLYIISYNEIHSSYIFKGACRYILYSYKHYTRLIIIYMGNNVDAQEGRTDIESHY